MRISADEPRRRSPESHPDGLFWSMTSNTSKALGGHARAAQKAGFTMTGSKRNPIPDFGSHRHLIGTMGAVFCAPW